MPRTSSATGPEPDPTRRTAAPLDDVDRRILDELGRDGRLSMSALADRVHISRAGAYSRVERLTRERVITGYGARIDPVRTGLTTSAYITMTVRQTEWRDLRRRLQAIPQIQHIALVGGEFDVIALVRTTDNAALRTLVLDVLQALPGVLNTRTQLIFDDVSAS